MIYSASTYSNAIDSLLELQKRSESDTEFATISFVVEAIQEKYQRDFIDRAPLTKQDLEKMDFQRVWLAYPSEEIVDAEDCGEWALVYDGLIYDLASLEGAGFANILLDCMQGESIERPSGKYQVYREPHFYIGE